MADGSVAGVAALKGKVSAEEWQARWRAYRRAGALCSDMETAALLVVASAKGLRAGSVLLVSDNQFAGSPLGPEPSMDDTIKVGLGALQRLIQGDSRGAHRPGRR